MRRPYRGPEDVGRLQQFAAQQVKNHGRIGNLHPGDVPHRIFNALRDDEPRDVVHIWEDDQGAIAAWTLLDPRGGGFDAQIAPPRRATSPHLERDLNVWSEETLLALMAEHGSEVASIETEAFVDDAPRVDLLNRLGWVRDERSMIVLGRRGLNNVDAPRLPPGYRLRSALGVDEAGALAELHAAGFGARWTAEQYRRLVVSPGYDPSRELVVETVDGDLAAFCVTWPDGINRTGLFEPVAVHPDHRRRHLAGALLRAGMLLMKDWGMDTAEVVYEEDNPGADRLYRGAGFEPVAEIAVYRKPISRES